MKQILLILLIGFILSITGCKKNSNIMTDNVSVNTYKDIPGVTEKEIIAIEKIKESCEIISYGSLIGTELFILPDGTYTGFTYDFCNLLTNLFGIKFEAEIYYNWDELGSKYNNMEVDFIGELAPTPERQQSQCFSLPIAEHALRIFTREDAPEIMSEFDTNGLKIGFLENTITAEYILNAYPVSFEIVEVETYEMAAWKLVSGEIDAFVEDADADPFFDDYGGIHSKKFFPLVYTPISMSTANPDLEPIISVVNKYLAAGGIDELLEMYIENEDKYSRYKLFKSFTDEEKAYLENLAAQDDAVKIAFEHDNYPVNFYNKSENEFQGIAIDILNEISRLTGIRFESATDGRTDWAKIIQKVKTGDIPMVAQLLYSESRKNNFIWSDTPYCTAYYALLSKSDYPNLSNYQVLRRNVGVTKQSAQVEIYNEWFPDNDNITGYDNLNMGLDALEAGEIDLLMASEYALLNQLSYREKSGYKVNILLSTKMESFFGFNKNEGVLCSIIDKSQMHVDTNTITRSWTNRVFDYSKKAASERSNYLLIFSSALFLVLVTVLLLLRRNIQLSKNLENMVQNRTYELERQTATLSTIYESIPDIVFCMDTDLVYTNCNISFEKFAGCTNKEIIGSTDPEIFSRNKEMMELFVKSNKSVLNNRKTEIIQELVTYPDGTQRHLETIKTPLFQNNILIGLLGIARDITEHKETEAAAQVASKAKGAFLANMSHEIRTPLNAIIGMANIAKNSILDKGKALDSINQVLTSSHHLLGILNDVLDMSKIESGKLELMYEPFNLLDAYNEVAQIITQRCLEKNINFTTNIYEMKETALIGDKLRVNQVLINLLGNSVKFTDVGGQISLLVRVLEEDDNSIRLGYSISDNGIGMTREQISKLFTPFEQADNSIASKFGGTGLGLSISQNLVNMMGGVIEVESELNSGSRFYFSLSFEKSKEIVRVLSETSYNLDLTGKKLLLVDDVDINRFIVCEILSSTGVEIVEAENGRQAVDKYVNSPSGFYDLIFMDVQMPVLDGYEATKEIRRLEREDSKRVPIIAMTANAYKEDIDNALAAGMNSHISKPIDVAILMKTIKGYLLE